MFKALFTLCQLTLLNLCYYWIISNRVSAQVTPDGTVNTQVNQNTGVAEITGGETRGDNLFHSFQDFSVDTGEAASFLNNSDIANIFSRVTGGNASNIDGLIRANGSANLFLINPAGIVFGEGARLDLGGSFYSSTASSILFEDGEFSAVDNLGEPILTINAPIGLGFRDNPREIVNRSRVENNSEQIVGLEVDAGNNLVFVGGNLSFEGGNATARGGNIYLGGLAAAGTVALNNDASLSFPEDVTLADITLTNAADIDTSGTGGGNITIDAQNLSLERGELGRSLIRAGISPDANNLEAQAGNIAINIAENITLNESRILNQATPGGLGNSGNIAITARSIEAINGGDISADTFTQGNAGNINITATGDLSFDGERSNGFAGGITSFVNSGGVGNAGDITISANNLNLTSGGQVAASTLGQGNGGNINITATGDLSFDGERSNGFASGVTSLVNSGGVGNAGDIAISTNNFTLTSGGRVATGTFGQGNGGNINITVTGDLSFDGGNSNGFASGVNSRVNEDAVGNAGDIDISTNNFTLTRGGLVDTSNSSLGNAGNIDITARGDITFNGIIEDSTSGSGSQIDREAGTITFSSSFFSGLNSGVNENAVGNAGDVTISTNNLVSLAGDIDTSTSGSGDAGNIDITATGDITLVGNDASGFNSASVVINSGVGFDAVGNAGDIAVFANNLVLFNGAQIRTLSGGRGDAGNINIAATEDLTIGGSGLGVDDISSGLSSVIGRNAVGNAGDVTISANQFNLTAPGFITTDTRGRGNSGNISIAATESVLINGQGDSPFRTSITSEISLVQPADAPIRNGGIIEINSPQFTATNGALVSSSSFQGSGGNAGDLIISAAESLEVNNDSLIQTNVFDGSAGVGGDLTIETANLTVANGGQISTLTLSEGDAGNLTVRATDSVLITGETETGSSALLAAALEENGNGGELNIVTQDLTVSDNAIISVGNFPTIEGLRVPGTGEPGNINIQANSIDVASGGRITAATQSTTGDAANIDLQVAEEIVLRDGSLISAEARSDANGGNLNIDTGFIVAFPSGNNDIIASAEQGEGGNININADAVLGISDRPLSDLTNDINASSEVSGLEGGIDIETIDFNPLQGLIEIVNGIIDTPTETTVQACNANREAAANSGLDILGKGGVPPAPELPLNSLNVYVDGDSQSPTSTIAPSIETSQGKIQPARGIRVTKSGKIVLTAYRTNSDTRQAETEASCS
ncbi:MAG: filamentous hemagglutinin N-terminal domain-containing protein [Cyanobacteria bacterium J06631_6]